MKAVPNAALALACLLEVSAAATYFVDLRTGDNTNPGTTPDSAWRDFTPVNGRTLQPGDCLRLRRLPHQRSCPPNRRRPWRGSSESGGQCLGVPQRTIRHS